jgi:hypothetical protein
MTIWKFLGYWYAVMALLAFCINNDIRQNQCLIISFVGFGVHEILEEIKKLNQKGK